MNHRIERTAWRAFAWISLFVAIVVGFSPETVAAQRRFAAPEDALAALVDALGKGDEAALIELFGEEHREFLIGGDPAMVREEWRAGSAAAREAAALRPAGDARRIVILGHQAWPLPFPLVRDGAEWRFDTAAGIEEIADRRIGRNELAAIAVLRAYVEAQRDYASRDPDNDRVAEYAQHLVSSAGRRDGLFWPSQAGEEESPFGPFIVEAAAYLAGHGVGDSYRGYYFRVLTRQGPNAPGGAFDYIINGHMVAGFALIAWPEKYGTTGIMTFLVNRNGRVLQKNLGLETESSAAATKDYDPDASWTEVDD